MNTDPKDILIYQAQDGKRPYADWFGDLKDLRAKASIAKRIDRLALGNPGDCKALKDGVYELRIHYGPGFRVYFAQEGEQIILLLLGGDKASQKQDIEKAKEFYDDYQSRNQL